MCGHPESVVIPCLIVLYKTLQLENNTTDNWLKQAATFSSESIYTFKFIKIIIIHKSNINKQTVKKLL